MAWDEEMVEVLRVLANDLDAPLQYTDERLMKTLIVAGFQAQQEVDFDQEYEFDVVNLTMDPDPTEDERDDAFVNLATLKAACIIDRGGAVAAATRAISVRDGGSAVDLRGVFAAKAALLEKGWCAVYADAKFEHEAGQDSPGAAVMTPFRLYAGWR